MKFEEFSSVLYMCKENVIFFFLLLFNKFIQSNEITFGVDSLPVFEKWCAPSMKGFTTMRSAIEWVPSFSIWFLNFIIIITWLLWNIIEETYH